MSRTYETLVPSLLLSCMVLWAGCGGGGSLGPFGHAVRDDDEGAVAAVARRIAATEAAPAPRPMVIGVGTTPPSLWAYDLEAGAMLWNQPAELEAQPYLAGAHVVAQETDGNIVVRRALDGTVVSRVPDNELALVGAAGEGDLAVFVLSTTSTAAGAHSRIVVLEGGRASRRYEVEQAVGRPAVHAGLIFVPWGHHTLSVLDPETGAEAARLRTPEHVISTVFADGHDVYLGATELARFGPEIVRGEASWYVPPAVERAAHVPMMFDAYSTPARARSAAHQVRMAFTPIPDGAGVGMLEDTLLQVFYRAIFGVEARGPGARWVTLLEDDVIGVAHDPEGVVAVDEAGRIVVLLPADGRVGLVIETGIASSYAMPWPGAWRPSLSASGPETELRDELVALAEDGDARLVPARVFALRLLAELPSEDVTEHTLRLCDSRELTAAVREAACNALAERENGAPQVIEALGRHAAFLDGTSPPPVGALARAALGMHESRAVPLLLEHLGDPATPTEELPGLFEALGGFHDASTVEPIAAFLRLYHAEPAESALAPGLVAAAFAYTELAGESATELLTALRDDSTTAPELVDAAGEALEIAEGAEPTATVVATTETEATEGMTEELPLQLTAAMVADVLVDERRALERCLVTPERVYGRARVILVVEPSGALSMVSVSPMELTDCVEPRVRSVSYPATRSRVRQHVAYEITRH